MFGPVFLIKSVLLGVSLAMDAFTVSVVSGMSEPRMPFSRKMKITGTFALFQFAMPMIGWICVHTIVEYFSAFRKAVPWIALILLSFLGIRMLFEAIMTKQIPTRRQVFTELNIKHRYNTTG